MTRFGWAAGVAACGIAVVGTVSCCVLYAIPDRPAARNWPQYAPLLLGPYAMCAMACWVSTAGCAGFVVRVAALVACGAGAVLAAVGPTLRGLACAFVALNRLL